MMFFNQVTGDVPLHTGTQAGAEGVSGEEEMVLMGQVEQHLLF